MSYIYVITNQINGKLYVGKTQNTIQHRFKEHCQDAYSAANKNRPLYKAFRKYGVENFRVSLLEECDIEKENEREQYWIDTLDTFHNGYNCTLGGDGTTKYDHDAIWHRYQEIGNIQQTAAEFGCDRRVVRSVINAHGIYHKAKGQAKPVLQLDKHTLEVIQEFSSSVKAAKSCGKTKEQATNIRAVIGNPLKSAFGYRWCYPQDYEAFLERSKVSS